MKIAEVGARRAALLGAALLVMLLWAPGALGAGRSAVYVQTNTVVNEVLAFPRAADGSLGPAERYATGGAGKPSGNPPLGIPYLDSAGSVTLSEDGRFLFVVNAGNNTVSSFRVGPGSLSLADVKPSFGLRPVSSTSHGSLLYVLNSDTAIGSISGYQVASDGGLTPIAGSIRTISQPVGGYGAQVQFDAKGRYLVVTERAFGGPGKLDVFAVDKNGVAAPPVVYPASDLAPFGVAFTNQNLMVVSNERAPFVPSSVSSYSFSSAGVITPIETEETNAAGACWTVITHDDKYTFVTSPFTQNVNSFRIEHDGSLSGVNGTSVVATTPGLSLDLALSHESRYLYVLDSAFFSSSQLLEYAVNGDGTLTPLGSSAPFSGSAAGTAAW
jgi:6-phosphogluconolactonase (cycloisomerase 2 family)